MPLYEYQCGSCGSVFEVIQKFSDDPLTVHEECGGAVHRLLSAPALQFKGTGWYITDYARSGSQSSGAEAKAKAEAKADGKSDAKGKSETKAESKPAASSSTSSDSSSSTSVAPSGSSSTTKK